MSESESDDPRAKADRELGQLRRQIDEARAGLAVAQGELAAARSALNPAQARRLLEANEQLVASALLAQGAARTFEEKLEEVSRATELDILTELPNRTRLLDRFANAMAQARRDRKRLGLLFLDLDNFKRINDTLGHAVGDGALKIVAGCLQTSVREVDTVSRHGGDEFLVLLRNVAVTADAVRVADKIIAALGKPCRVGNHVLRLTASIGISIYPDHGDNAATLIDKADAAMYLAKKHSLGRFVFNEPENVDPHGSEPPATD